jgi:hypothetical protein
VLLATAGAVAAWYWLRRENDPKLDQYAIA